MKIGKYKIYIFSERLFGWREDKDGEKKVKNPRSNESFPSF